MTITTAVEKKVKFLATGIFADFKISREDWDIHKLEDGTKIRSKVVLMTYMSDKSLEDAELQIRDGKIPTLETTFNFQTLMAIEAPIELRGKPDKATYNPKELKPCIVAPHLNFETQFQAWNIYNLGYGHILKLRLTPIDFSRTSKHDANGMPVYVFDSNVEAKLILSQELQNLLDKIEKKKPPEATTT
ncbi:MAG: hypothetical protein ACBZ72_02825 [Candidatus Bathyarchaeia archaeon]|jgi:hypothetical protein